MIPNPDIKSEVASERTVNHTVFTELSEQVLEASRRSSLRDGRILLMSKQASAQRVSMSLTSGESAAEALTHCLVRSISSISLMDEWGGTVSLFVVGIIFLNIYEFSQFYTMNKLF